MKEVQYLLKCTDRYLGVTPNFAAVNTSENWSQRRKLIAGGLARLLQKSAVDANITKVLKNIIYEELDRKIDGNNECMWYPHRCAQNIAFNTVYLAMFNKILKLDDPLFIEYADCTTILLEQSIPVAIAAYIAGNGRIGKIISDIILGKQVKQYGDAMRQVYKHIRNDYNHVTKSESDEDENIYDPKGKARHARPFKPAILIE